MTSPEPDGPNEPLLTPAERLRRAALLCLHCLANLAYFRATREAIDVEKIAANDFNIRIANNFLDTGILEWCKLFADHNAKHFWRRVLAGDNTVHEAWKQGLMAHIGLIGQPFADYVGEMKTYRDKFIAHLDEQRSMHIPDLDPAIKATQYLYQRLVELETPALNDPMPEAPRSGTDYYLDRFGFGQTWVGTAGKG